MVEVLGQVIPEEFLVDSLVTSPSSVKTSDEKWM